MHVPVEVAESRDPKGLYRRARAGEIREFTGISAPYEEPENAEVVIHGERTSVEEAVVRIVGVLEERALLGKEGSAEAEEENTNRQYLGEILPNENDDCSHCWVSNKAMLVIVPRTHNTHKLNSLHRLPCGRLLAIPKRLQNRP